MIVVAALAVGAMLCWLLSTLLFGDMSELKTHREDVDAIMAEQYPDFEVLEVNTFTNYRGTGGQGFGYIMRYRTNPDFELLVAVVRSGTELGFPTGPDTLTRIDVDWYANDAVFNASARDANGLPRTIIDEFVATYCANKPTPTCLASTPILCDTDYFDPGMELLICGKVHPPGHIGGLEPTHYGRFPWLADDSVYDEPEHIACSPWKYGWFEGRFVRPTVVPLDAQND